MTVLTCAPMIIMVPREEVVRRNIILELQYLGVSISFDEQRDFVCAKKNVNVPAFVLSAALMHAGIAEVGFNSFYPFCINNVMVCSIGRPSYVRAQVAGV